MPGNFVSSRRALLSAARCFLAIVAVTLIVVPSASAGVTKTTAGQGFYGSAIASAPDGRLLAGGSLNLSGRKQVFAVARYSKDGKLDRSFGTKGIAQAQLGDGTLNDLASLTVMPDGKILATGTIGFGGLDVVRRPGELPRGYGVAQWTASGKLDTGFGGGDGVELYAPGQFGSYSGHVMPFGGGVALGGATNFKTGETAEGEEISQRLLCVILRDTAFTAPGRDACHQAPNIQRPNFLDGQQAGAGLALAYGGTFKADRMTPEQIRYGVALLRADGTPDPSFGTNGFTTTDFGTDDDGGLGIGGGLVARPGGGWLVGATAVKTWGLAAYDAAGRLDPAFGSGGKLLLDADKSRNEDELADLVAVGGGKVLAAGTDYKTSTLRFARLKANGALDKRFGSGGRAQLGFNDLGGMFPRFASMVTQSRGRVVVVTSARGRGTRARETLLLFRLLADGRPDRRFGTSR